MNNLRKKPSKLINKNACSLKPHIHKKKRLLSRTMLGRFCMTNIKGPKLDPCVTPSHVQILLFEIIWVNVAFNLFNIFILFNIRIHFESGAQCIGQNVTGAHDSTFFPDLMHRANKQAAQTVHGSALMPVPWATLICLVICPILVRDVVNVDTCISKHEVVGLPSSLHSSISNTPFFGWDAPLWEPWIRIKNGLRFQWLGKEDYTEVLSTYISY